MDLAREPIHELALIGVEAFTTTRAAGSFGTTDSAPVGEVMLRWSTLVEELERAAGRVASARQVHGFTVATHSGDWRGWLRLSAADGHVAPAPGTALAATVADCVPVFLAHPAGAVALLHAGWRGTAGGILARGVAALEVAGAPARDLHLHLGPAICGRCYEVGPDVYSQLTGRAATEPQHVDLRDLLAGQARALGIRSVSASAACTRCDNDRFYSHRAGDSGRQLAVIYARR